ncbi:MAG: pro-sigmaK processing inhibitor BofA family protein [Roseburia sp.]|nr:pro-sigmaK processing inhibitor BofA family protein [Roseburia sp.]MCM1099230.1 pro-sigmaK processing inhibitor BofA family protein [Ruminococcus flavefaciens]
MRREWWLNLVMRSIIGVVAIYFINMALAERGIFLGVGINPCTVLTSGILGIPGVAVLYGIGLYKNL